MARRSGTELVSAIYEAINARNLTALDGLFAADFVDHQEDHHGVEPLKAQLEVFFGAFPDLRVEVDEVVGDGDRLGSRTTVRGTNNGELMGIPPSGRTISVHAVDLIHVRDGRVAERWGGLDMYSLLIQLGIIPAPDPA